MFIHVRSGLESTLLRIVILYYLTKEQYYFYYNYHISVTNALHPYDVITWGLTCCSCNQDLIAVLIIIGVETKALDCQSRGPLYNTIRCLTEPI